MFSNLFSSSISFATVTPSLVIVGEPKLLSMTTLRPFGPSVTLTTSASVLTPFRMASRARWSKMMSLAAMCAPQRNRVELLALDDAEDAFLAHDEVFFAANLDLGPGHLGEDLRNPLDE
jgi:hypothetical protein